MKSLLRVFLIITLFLIFSVPLSAKTMNSPALSAEQTIILARKYVKDNKIDVSRRFLVKVEYVGLHDEYNQPFWRIEYQELAGGKGNQTFIFVYQDGTINHGYGK